MPSALGFIGGGLLSGIGKGLVLTGKQKYERAMKRFEQERAQKDALELEGVKQKNRHGLLSQQQMNAMERLGVEIGGRKDAETVTNKASGDIRAEASRSAETVANIGADSREAVANIAAGAKSTSADSSAAEKRAFDSLVKIHTVADENGLETVDWNAVAQGLDEKGFGKLAGSARSRGKGIADLDTRRRAEQFADQMVDEQSGAFSTDASDFKEDGGSRTRFRARMVRDYIAKNGGGAAEAPATRPATARPPAPAGDPYTSETPPPGFPNARRSSKDGFWYFPDPERPGKFRRVLN